jgi:hypothetical protein
VNTVAALRAAAGTGHEDPRLFATVGELSLRSEEFRRFWARRGIRRKTRESKRFQHPPVGELTLCAASAASEAAGKDTHT